MKTDQLEKDLRVSFQLQINNNRLKSMPEIKTMGSDGALFVQTTETLAIDIAVMKGLAHGLRWENLENGIIIYPNHIPAN